MKGDNKLATLERDMTRQLNGITSVISRLTEEEVSFPQV